MARKEKRPIVIHKYVKVLSHLTGNDLIDDKTVNEIFESIPEQYKEERKRSQKGMIYRAETKRPFPRWREERDKRGKVQKLEK